MKRVNIAVVGATGMVGSFFVKVLQERDFPAENIYFYASFRSAGKVISFKGQEHTIRALDDSILDENIDIALFSAGGDISEVWIPKLSAKGIVCVDNSSKFRMADGVPLVVPEVNAIAAKAHKGIIANPNCSTIQSVVALAPLDKAFGLKRVIYTTYQAVSGAGQGGWDDLQRGLDGLPPQKFPHTIANNVIPQIDVFTENGYTGEEIKMIQETRKILGIADLPVTATCVRVPIFNVHSVCINVELANKFDINELVQVLQNADGIVVLNDVANGEYPMPITANGKDEVYIGRIRRDESAENAVNMWVVADNVRKGATTNAVQIAELLV